MKICERCRYTVAIILGVIGLLINIIGFIVVCINFGEKEGGVKKGIKFLIVTASSGLISVLFIVGVVKRKHKLLISWLFFMGAGIFAICKVIVVHIVKGAKKHIDGTEFTIQLVVYFITLGIVIAIFWFSYSLYKEMKRIAKHSSSIPNGGQINNTDYNSVPTINTVNGEYTTIPTANIEKNI